MLLSLLSKQLLAYCLGVNELYLLVSIPSSTCPPALSQAPPREGFYSSGQEEVSPIREGFEPGAGRQKEPETAATKVASRYQCCGASLGLPYFWRRNK